MTLILCYNGWLGLCLAMPKYCRQVLQQDAAPPSQHILRIIGWACLMGSLGVSVAVEGWSFGPVAWVGHLAVMGLALVCLLPYVPRIVLALGALGMASVIALWFT
ncbi:MAG: DUF3325 domain-containing protein [Nitrospira sp.]|nr:DUF3325 domain-containing protein [Nitrospira sp.]